VVMSSVSGQCSMVTRVDELEHSWIYLNTHLSLDAKNCVNCEVLHKVKLKTKVKKRTEYKLPDCTFCLYVTCTYSEE